MTNLFYTDPINGIYADQEAKLFLVSNVSNQIFTFDPFTSSTISLDSFLILKNFSSSLI